MRLWGSAMVASLSICLFLIGQLDVFQWLHARNMASLIVNLGFSIGLRCNEVSDGL